MKKMLVIILLAMTGTYGISHSILHFSMLNEHKRTISSNPNEVLSAQVDIEKMRFSPANITVTEGTTVTWTNKQWFVSHSVTSHSEGVFDSGKLKRNEIFSYTFCELGSFYYTCSFHPEMHGCVNVGLEYDVQQQE